MTDEYPDAAARKRIDAELAVIDQGHAAVMRKCTLCGQLTTGLDKFGLCSRISITHAQVRGDMPQGRKK